MPKYIQVNMFEYLSRKEYLDREVKFCYKCYKSTNGERRPWKKEYWLKRLHDTVLEAKGNIWDQIAG